MDEQVTYPIFSDNVSVRALKMGRKTCPCLFRPQKVKMTFILTANIRILCLACHVKNNYLILLTKAETNTVLIVFNVASLLSVLCC
jgi:hypothetical protein